MKTVIIVTGQTATGKTSYAIKLAKEKNGELVNCDSRQLYKHLNIITGKDIPGDCHFDPDTNRERNLNSKTSVGCYTIQGVRLWLYDLVDPKLPFSSFDYKEIAGPVIDDIIARGKTPIIVGGSYLYIKHLLYGFDTENISPDWKLREELNAKSVEKLQKELQKNDSERFEKMNNSDRNNPRRLIRHIEICRNNLRLHGLPAGHTPPKALPTERRQGNSTPGVVQAQLFRHPEFISGSRNPTPLLFEGHSKFGMTVKMLSQVQHDIGVGKLTPGASQLRTPGFNNFNVINFTGLRFEDNNRLAEVIKKRVEERIIQGAFEEVKKLLNMGYSKLDPGLNTIGYKEIIAFLEGKCAKQQAIDRWILSEIQYAKRQYTFMKKDKNIVWKIV